MTGTELRASILQAAVQGRLVPQDPTDEPVSMLLERIREERRALVKATKTKAAKGGESVITRYSDGTVWEQRGKGKAVDITDEVPFDIPDGWEWARIGSLIEIERGGSPRPIKSYITTRDDGINWIKIGDTDKDGKYITQTREKIRPEGMKRSRYVTPGDFLLTNSMSFGRPYILQTDGCIHDGWLVLRRPDVAFDKDYLYWLLSSPAMFRQFADLAAGSAVKNLNIDKVKDSLVPIPPLAEQRRIVTKLDELMPLVERYDGLDRERTELNADIGGAIRASVLQAAVQGKLVPQDPTDEPASKLFERIREERRALVKAKKAKVPKGGESVIWRASDGTVWEQRGKDKAVDITEEIPFDIPERWEWARLNQIGEIVGGGTPKTSEPSFWASDNDPDGIPWITPADMRDMGGLMVSRGARNITKAGLEGSSAQLMPAGAVLMSSRAPIGYLGIAANPVSTNQGFKSVVCIDTGLSPWVATAIDALMDSIKERASGTTFKEISGTEFGLTVIPVPPLAEQRRIVAKLDEMLPKVERLGELVS